MRMTGARMRQPAALLAGLMWFDPDRRAALDNIRHNAQERDGRVTNAYPGLCWASLCFQYNVFQE